MISLIHSRVNPDKRISKTQFISLRWQLIIAFTFLFTGIFSITFYWFYTFATNRAMQRLKADMVGTLQGTLEGIDTSDLLDLYENGEPNEEGFSDDPKYLQQLEWFKQVNSIEPSAWLYTYLVRSTEKTTKNPDGKELVYLVDLWATQEDTSKAAGFLQVEPCPCPQSMRMFEMGEIEIDDEIYTDRFGNWISAYAPLRQEKDGKVEAILGLDLKASHVRDVQKAIRARILFSFSITYAVIFILVYLFTGIFTKNLNRLKIAADAMGEGEYNQNLDALINARFSDEISTLADVFKLMANKIKGREEKLKQQVAELKIEIDESKRKKQVAEITESDFFQDLQARAKEMRKRKRS